MFKHSYKQVDVSIKVCGSNKKDSLWVVGGWLVVSFGYFRCRPPQLLVKYIVDCGKEVESEECDWNKIRIRSNTGITRSSKININMPDEMLTTKCEFCSIIQHLHLCLCMFTILCIKHVTSQTCLCGCAGTVSHHCPPPISA